VSSVDAFIAESPYADYNASKAGLSMLTRSMAFELGHLGVRVTAVAPGATVTPMLEGGFEDGVYRRYMDITPAKRYATPEEQANVVLFLASDEASYVNGVTVRVDGGMLQGFWADPRLDPPLPAGPI
jgi:NAD(P)-dependent dehydrogenase (short-subunit alcohol dehydrogenase family)